MAGTGYYAVSLAVFVCLSFYVGWRSLSFVANGPVFGIHERTTTRENEASVASEVQRRSGVADIFAFNYTESKAPQNASDWNLHVHKSSLDYYACCGAGHRLIRTAAAYFLARHINFGLRVFWGWCANVELYEHLFGPEPLEDLERVTSEYNRTVFYNDVAKIGSINRQSKVCPCSDDKIKMDERYYSSLKSRFIQHKQVQDFGRKYFRDAPLTIGMHIRAGNNETGHFVRKKRGIDNTTQWLWNVAGRIQSLLHHRRPNLDLQEKPPVLYVATDTPSLFDRLKSILSNQSLLVLQYPNALHRKEGEGVVFGGPGSATPQDGECLEAWESTLADMFILSQVDILVAPRTSSFSQGLPMSLVFAQRQEREKVLTPSLSSLPPAYCEMDRAAETMSCYRTYMEWCCNGTTDQRDAVLFPYPQFYDNNTDWIQINRRKRKCRIQPGRVPKRCLPLRWNST